MLGGTEEASMTDLRISRRRFAGVLGAAVGGTVLARNARAATPAPVATPQAAPAPAATPEVAAAVIRLDSNENPYGPSKAALKAMERSQSEAARYPDALEDALTAELAHLHSVQPEQIVLGCGSGEILRMADMAFLGPEKQVVVAEPTFEAVSAFAQVARATPIKVPLTVDHRHDLEKMAGACTVHTGMVYVCNPNNPTGTVVTRAEMASFLKRLPADTVVLVDEAYHHFVEDADYGSSLELLASHPNLVVVRTFSKIYGLAGMRLGYGVGTKERAAAMARYKNWSNANVAVAEAALASLKEPDLVLRQRNLLNDTRRWLCDALTADGRRFVPSETNFLMIHLGRDVQPVIASFRERGILTGRRFPSMPDWLRITVGTKEEMAAFVKGLREIMS
jgi:histidinol-phosphate aminotransferase